MNEETLKNSLIVPFLGSIGLDPGGLSFEHRFTIQLGRAAYTIDGLAATRADGRADILCRRDGRPFLIVELKEENASLTDDDRRQALSYARLLDPMAPFTMLSNGSETHVFNTITGDKLDPALARTPSAFTADIETDLQLRLDALHHFVGYSRTNLLAFCRSQNALYTRPLRPRDSEPLDLQLGRKFLPAVYVPRVDLHVSVEDFFAQGVRCVFPVIGDAGTGKTNFLCHLLEQYSDRPILFYSGSFLSNSLFHDIASDFNIVFSPQNDAAGLLKRLSALLRPASESLVIAVDSLDEWDAPDKVSQISQLAAWAAPTGTRLIIACKTQAWSDFLSRHGTPTLLSDCLYQAAPPLADFDPTEVSLAVSKYSQVFGAQISRLPRSGVSVNPLALRVAFEAAKRSAQPVDLANPTRAMFAQYLSSKLAGTPDAPTMLRFLVTLCRAMLAADQYQISEDSTDLGLHPLATTPRPLITGDLLYRFIDDTGQAHVGFYFSTIRDHLVAVHVLRLQSGFGALSSASSQQIIGGGVGESGGAYFFRTGNPQEQKEYFEHLIAQDTTASRRALVRLLSWEGTRAAESSLSSVADALAVALSAAFSESVDDELFCEQIFNALDSLPFQYAEGTFVDMFATLLRQQAPRCASYASKIARRLAAVSTSPQSGRLVELALDRGGDGYVRRYVVESLAARTDFDRRAVFRSLIADPEVNVRHWSRSWYVDLEDESLRDELVTYVDSFPKAGATVDVVCALGTSKLVDTGQLLFERARSGLLTGPALWWAARALGWLHFKSALDWLFEQFEVAPESDLGGHALLAIGEMGAPEAVTRCLGVFSRLSNSAADKNAFWLMHTFRALASKEDYAKVAVAVVEKSAGGRSNFVSALILGTSGHAEFDDLVVDYIIQGADRTDDQRLTVLLQWIEARELCGPQAPALPERIVEWLCAAILAAGPLFGGALMLLVNHGGDLRRVADLLMDSFPRLTKRFGVLLFPWYDDDRWVSFGRLIRVWLHGQLLRSELTETEEANLWALAECVADESTLRVINANRSLWEERVGREVVSRLEDGVRRLGVLTPSRSR